MTFTPNPVGLALLVFLTVSLQIVVGHDSSVLAESAVYHTQRQRVLAAYQTATAQRDVVRHTRIVTVTVGVGILSARNGHKQYLVPVGMVLQPGGIRLQTCLHLVVKMAHKAAYVAEGVAVGRTAVTAEIGVLEIDYLAVLKETGQ